MEGCLSGCEDCLFSPLGEGVFLGVIRGVRTIFNAEKALQLIHRLASKLFHLFGVMCCLGSSMVRSDAVKGKGRRVLDVALVGDEEVMR